MIKAALPTMKSSRKDRGPASIAFIPDGDVIDCVLSHIQPAFDHPELQGKNPLDPPRDQKAIKQERQWQRAISSGQIQKLVDRDHGIWYRICTMVMEELASLILDVKNLIVEMLQAAKSPNML
ncbi:unnamed protein product [Dovyalis caffra]|uniref:Neprosin activation peptide domain-containing protein n=1 Tax=Dovyalis caffra TaxID=77055 RepID=A0AAV1SAL0_9ROSI|nr:unnamed protein product [Dovyalis caffra]